MSQPSRPTDTEPEAAPLPLRAAERERATEEPPEWSAGNSRRARRGKFRAKDASGPDRCIGGGARRSFHARGQLLSAPLGDHRAVRGPGRGLLPHRHRLHALVAAGTGHRALASGAGAVRIVLVPTLAGLLLAFMVLRIFPRVKGSGVTQTKSAVYIYDGYIPFDTVIGKFLTCALAIGSGQSLGPEDPSLQMGAGIASALGRRLHLSREKVRLIAPVGAAAGLAAAFNAPISAVLFVIEEVIGTWSAGILGAVVLAAVGAAVVMRAVPGRGAAVPNPGVHAWRMPPNWSATRCWAWSAGVTSLIFVKLLRWVRARARRMPRWTLYVQPALAGLIIGVIGLKFPQVMGAGYEYMDQAMHGQFLWHTLLALALLKVVATTPLDFQRRAGRNVRADVIYRSHGGRGGGDRAASLFPRRRRSGGRLRAGGHGHAFRRISARADDFGLHGAGSERELFHYSAGDHLQHHRLRHWPALPGRRRFST